jgi:hypothetical protein
MKLERPPTTKEQSEKKQPKKWLWIVGLTAASLAAAGLMDQTIDDGTDNRQRTLREAMAEQENEPNKNAGGVVDRNIELQREAENRIYEVDQLSQEEIRKLRKDGVGFDIPHIVKELENHLTQQGKKSLGPEYFELLRMFKDQLLVEEQDKIIRAFLENLYNSENITESDLGIIIISFYDDLFTTYDLKGEHSPFLRTYAELSPPIQAIVRSSVLPRITQMIENRLVDFENIKDHEEIDEVKIVEWRENHPDKSDNEIRAMIEEIRTMGTQGRVETLKKLILEVGMLKPGDGAHLELRLLEMIESLKARGWEKYLEKK